MSEPSSPLPARPSLEQLRKQAKDRLRARRAQNPDATLADEQFSLAREYGFESWAKLKHHIEGLQPRERLEQYQKLAMDLVSAYRGDAEALQRVNDLFLRSLTRDELRALIQQRMRAVSGAATDVAEVTLDDAQALVARLHGFESWPAFVESVAQPRSDPPSATLGLSATPPFYKIDWNTNTIEPGPLLADKDWDTIFDVMKAHQITGLNAAGQLSDSALQRLPRLDFVTRLNTGGTKRMTDDGLQQLARMPQLQELDLSEYPGGRITDRGLEVLRHLPALRKFHMCWQRGITDAGVANLAACDHLESVNVMGTHTGDGAINALSGKPNLHHFKTGRLVTDAGLPLFHRFPLFETWHGGEIRYDLMSFGAEPTDLLIDGPFTAAGLASLAGLRGLFGLSFFWHTSALKPEGLASLIDFPNLGFLGCQGALCTDEAMRHIAAMPRLRMLMGQGTVASDEGFEALSRSQTIEYIWGRECPNLKGRGFAALAAMPSLKGLAVSCKHVDDAALSTLPRFPALRGLMPMDVPDEGFRHVGRCAQLEDLWCMYCRDTTDAATEHIAGLSTLKSYYAGYSRITDRSLEILSRMSSLEKIVFEGCSGIGNAGVARLASLPRLREVSIGGSPNVTRDGAAVFPRTVRVNYWS